MTYAAEATERRFPSLAEQMSKWVDHVLGPGYQKYRPSDAWSPSINLREDPSHYCLVVDLAVESTEEIQDILTVEKGMLIISGARRTPGLTDLRGPVRVHHMEIEHGRFFRALPLPDDVNAEAIQANYRNGLLWVMMPKKNS